MSLSLRHRARMYVGARAVTADLAARVASGGRKLISPATQLVIEAYPRSGLTFVASAVRYAQPGPIEIASHMHTPGQVAIAVRRRKPTLVLVREPRDAVVSFTIFSPEIGPHLALREWLDFYNRIRELRNHLVVATFNEATTDLGAVIDRVNGRFETGFCRFDHSPSHVDAVMANISQFHRSRHEGDVQANQIAIPTPSRDALKASTASVLDEPRYARRIGEAEQLYRVLAQPG